MRKYLLFGAPAVLLLMTGFQDTQIRVEVEAVNVFVTVTDRQGRFVTDLTQDRFILYEDGIPQEFTNFSREGNQPLNIGLLIDTSGSVRLKLGFEQEAAINFIRGVMRRNDRALLVEFDHGVSLLHDFTHRPSTIVEGIRGLRAGGGTALWDAIYLVARDKMTDRDVRKTIVIVSDGEDVSSSRTIDETLEMVHTSEVAIYSIGTSRFGASSSRRGERNLERIAEETGGAAFFPHSASLLDEAFDRINTELRSQYSLTYTPRDTTPDGRFRAIEVRLVDGRDYRTRYRKGYRLPDF